MFVRGEKRKTTMRRNFGFSALSVFLGGILATLALSTSGCMTNKVGSPAVSNKATVGITTVNQLTAPLINVTNVFPTQVDPTHSLDIIGDESIGQYCKPLSPTSQIGVGPSTCQCFFQYTVLGSTTPQTKPVDTTAYQLN